MPRCPRTARRSLPRPATFRLSAVEPGRVVPGHTGELRAEPVAVHPWSAAHQPSSTLHASAWDLGAWLAAVTSPSPPLLSREGYDRMGSAQAPIPAEGERPPWLPTSMALGWFRGEHCGGPILLHGGRDPGYSGIVALLPRERVAVAVAANKVVRDDEMVLLAHKVLELGRGVPQSPGPVSIAVPVFDAYERGGIEAAEATYRRLMSLDDYGGYAAGAGELSWAGHEIGRLGRTDDAVAVYTLEAEQYPEWGFPYLNSAITYHKAGRIEEARSSYRLCAQKQPDICSRPFDEELGVDPD